VDQFFAPRLAAIVGDDVFLCIFSPSLRSLILIINLFSDVHLLFCLYQLLFCFYQLLILEISNWERTSVFAQRTLKRTG